MNSLIGVIETAANRLETTQNSIRGIINFMSGRGGASRRIQNQQSYRPLSLETLEPRIVLAAVAINSGDWTSSSTWENGVLPSDTERVIISHGVTVELDGIDHLAQELVIQGTLIVPESVSNPDKTLTTRWIHVNSGGEFQVGSEFDRYDEGTFTLNLTGTDVYADHVIETNMGGTNPSTMNISDNDGFLMTAMGGRVQFFGEDKLSFTKLFSTAEIDDTTIVVNNIIERNYDKGAMSGSDFVTSAADDGQVNWQIGDQIVIASSSYDYKEEDVRVITAVVDNGNGTSTLTLDESLDYRHYGEKEFYGGTNEAGTTPAMQTYEIDMRAEVALLSRNIKIQGDAGQDTDVDFGDQVNAIIEPRIRSTGLSPNEPVSPTQVANGVGGHLMFMPDSGQITVDGVQLEGLGQTSQKGRYPIHWHLGNDQSGDVLRNSSITNSNNRGVTIHGTSNLLIEGVVLHDIHGHGFFFEDAVETGNELIANIAFGIHKVGGSDKDFANPGGTDPFVVDTHDNVTESNSRFLSSAAFWITNPTNTFVGNISAGASGTGFWYALPRTVLGASAANPLYDGMIPVYSEFGQFDYNTSHSTPVGLNFDRGEDIEDANPNGILRTNNNANNYSPRVGGVESGASTTNNVYGFTNYKATDAGVYHRGQAETVLFNDLLIADSFNAVWSVSENIYTNSLFVGHSMGNADYDAEVGGPRLYDGSGLYSTSHFAGFADDDAYTFQVEGSSFGPTMYHVFQNTSFENDGTYGHIAHAESDFTKGHVGHNLEQPHQWSKAAIDLDGTLTGAAGGGVGYSIVPYVDFLIDSGDIQPAGWDAWLSEDIYTRVKVGNANSGEILFQSDKDEPVIRFTAQDGDIINASSGQSNGDAAWIQVAAKADIDGFVEGTFTVEFLTNGLPTTIFDLNTGNQDGERPALVPAIEAKVIDARIVVKIVGAGNYITNKGTEVFTETSLRQATNGIAYFRDNVGNLYFNMGILDSQGAVQLTPGAPLQTAYVSRTIEYGTTIQAEEFDNGIDGIAYHDTDSTNTLGTFRDDTGVDTTTTHVGDIADGEWLEYTGEIVGGAYDIGLNVASISAGGQIRVMAATSNSAGFLTELGTLDVPNTGGTFSTLLLAGVDLDSVAGLESVIRLEFVGGGFEVDSIQFDAPAQTTYLNQARSISIDTTKQIKLVEFDEGGQGVSYNDTTPTNTVGTFRENEGVDNNGDIVTNDVFEGEWMEFTTNIDASVYDITLKKNWGGVGSGVKLFIGDSNSATEFTELGVFAFASGDAELITLNNIDLSPWDGPDRVIRAEIVGNFMGIDNIEFAPQNQTPGDYNLDGSVDAADYTVWRDNLAPTTAVIPFSGADGNGDGFVTASDRTMWVASYGNSYSMTSLALATASTESSNQLEEEPIASTSVSTIVNPVSATSLQTLTNAVSNVVEIVPIISSTVALLEAPLNSSTNEESDKAFAQFALPVSTSSYINLSEANPLSNSPSEYAIDGNNDLLLLALNHLNTAEEQETDFAFEFDKEVQETNEEEAFATLITSWKGIL